MQKDKVAAVFEKRQNGKAFFMWPAQPGAAACSVHHCNRWPLQYSHKPSMESSCLVAQSTLWSSCDCINLWELISCSHEWESGRERKRRKDQKNQRQRFLFCMCESLQQCERRQKTIQLCFAAALMPPKSRFLSRGLFFGRENRGSWRAGAPIFDTELSGKWSEAKITAQHPSWL